MNLAETANANLRRFSSVTGTALQTKEDDEYSVDTDTTPDDAGAEAPPEDSGSGTSQLEQVITDALTDLGLTSVKSNTEDDGDIYADLAFESGESISLQFYVADGAAVMALLTQDNTETPPEVALPESLVSEDGTFNLSAVGDIPVDDIKSLVSQVITVSNSTESYRRFRGTQESVKLPGTKRRISIKYRNENAKLKQQIKKLKNK